MSSLTQEERLRTGLELLRKLHQDLIDLEIQLQLELMGNSADSGFTEAMEDVREHWSRFNNLFED